MLDPSQVTDCHIVSRPHPRQLSRVVGEHPKGTLIEAFFQRSTLGRWRVILVRRVDGGIPVLISQSPWKNTRIIAERWLRYRTRAA
jgi:hypothetical protein